MLTIDDGLFFYSMGIEHYLWYVLGCNRAEMLNSNNSIQRSCRFSLGLGNVEAIVETKQKADNDKRKIPSQSCSIPMRPSPVI